MQQPPAFTPYINCPGNAREVFEHYQQLFGGELEVMSYDDFPDPSAAFGFTPPAGSVAHASLHGGHVTIAGGDSVMTQTPAPLESGVYSFLIQPAEVETAKQIAQAIVDGGGAESMPIEQAPWGAYYGQVKDRFGVMWQFNVEGQHHQA